jgi:hypothetical protein
MFPHRPTRRSVFRKVACGLEAPRAITPCKATGARNLVISRKPTLGGEPANPRRGAWPVANFQGQKLCA